MVRKNVLIRPGQGDQDRIIFFPPSTAIPFALRHKMMTRRMQHLMPDHLPVINHDIICKLIEPRTREGDFIKF